jgi:hypothetical protein
MPVTAFSVSTRGAVRIDQAVEAVFEADALDTGGGGRFDDGADDGVEARRITAARQDADALDDWRHRTLSLAGRPYA